MTPDVIVALAAVVSLVSAAVWTVAQIRGVTSQLSAEIRGLREVVGELRKDIDKQHDASINLMERMVAIEEWRKAHD